MFKFSFLTFDGFLVVVTAPNLKAADMMVTAKGKAVMKFLGARPVDLTARTCNGHYPGEVCK